jgi:DNA polymerase I-like protein with 3'-5' exonuclease and polymerase domains
MQAWNDEKVIAFDFETSGLKPEYALQAWRVAQEKSWATSLVWAGRKNNKTKFCGGLNPTREDMKEMLEYAIQRDCYLMAHNASFDIGWLIGYGLEELVMKAKFLDSMLIWKHATIVPEYDTPLNKRFSYGLKAGVAQLWPDEAGYEDGVDFHDASPEARAKLHRYNERDVEFCLRLGKFWFEKLTDKQRNAMLIEAEALPLMAMAHVKGLPVNVATIEPLKEKLAAREAELMQELKDIGVDGAIVRSNKELAVLLFETWGLPIIKRTESGGASTDKDVLHELSLIDPRAAKIAELRNTLNRQSGFLAQIEASLEYNEDGMTHPEPRIFAAYTGRVQYSGSVKGLRPNKNKAGAFVEEKKPSGAALQQVPKAAEFRNLIMAPPGMTLVESDASSQEFRWMAIASNDPVMLDLCRPGEDPHSYMGAQIARINYADLVAGNKAGDKKAKAARNLGKLANLSLGYRTSAKKLRQKARTDWGLAMELPEAENIHAAYRAAYPGVVKFWERQRNICASQKFAETFGGRRVNMRQGWGGDKEWSMHSTTINFPVQGTGADQKFLAIKHVKPLLKKYGARLALDLHDGLYWFCPSGVVDAFIHDLRDTLNDLPYEREWEFKPSAPLTWDIKSGATWGALDDYEFEELGGGSDVAQETNPGDGVAPSTANASQAVRRPEPGASGVVVGTVDQGARDGQGEIVVENNVSTSQAQEDAVSTSPLPFHVSNEFYARAVFGEFFEHGWLQAGGDKAGNWTGGFAPSELLKMMDDSPNYISVASLKPDAKTRSDETFARAHMWVADDVGTKIGADIVEATFGPPNAIIETSAGNFQWHYWLSRPIENITVWGILRDAFKNSEKLSGAADGNGAGAYYRLPNGAAFKKKDPSKAGFVTRLVKFSPGASRLGQDDLARILGVDISDAAQGAYEAFKRDSKARIKRAGTDTSVLAADPILALFSAVKWPIHDYRINRQGFIAIECPWADQHTDGNTEAGYHVTSGGFKCFHAHCAGRTVKDLHGFLEGLATPDEKGKATALMFRNDPVGDQDLTGLEDLAGDIVREREDIDGQMSDFVWIKNVEKFAQISTGLVLTKSGFNMIATDLADAGASGMKAASSVFINDGGRVVDLITYAPGDGVVTSLDMDGARMSAYNQWRPGFIDPYPFDSVPDDDADLRKWLDHVEYIVENDNERAFFLDWAAFLVKHPGKKINFAVLLRSKQGVGKDLMLQPLVELLGKHNVKSIPAGVLDEGFSDYMKSRLVIVEELPPYHKKDVYERLKSLVSSAQEYTRVNEKNIPAYQIRNLQAWVLMSNHENAMALAEDDRRYFVIGSDVEKKAPEYYEATGRAFKSRAVLSKLYRWLLDRDLSRFNPMAAPPMTHAKAMMIEHARPPLDRWFEHIFGDEGIFSDRTLITVGEIEAEAINTTRLSKRIKNDLDPQLIVAQLRRYSWEHICRANKGGGAKVSLWGVRRRAAMFKGVSHPSVVNMWKSEVDKTNTKRTLGLFED